jgi:hypothetical protein
MFAQEAWRSGFHSASAAPIRFTNNAFAAEESGDMPCLEQELAAARRKCPGVLDSMLRASLLKCGANALALLVFPSRRKLSSRTRKVITLAAWVIEWMELANLVQLRQSIIHQHWSALLTQATCRVAAEF